MPHKRLPIDRPAQMDPFHLSCPSEIDAVRGSMNELTHRSTGNDNNGTKIHEATLRTRQSLLKISKTSVADNTPFSYADCLGTAIREIRREHGLSQATVADRLACLVARRTGQDYLSKVESGRIRPPLRSLDALCRSIDCELDELLLRARSLASLKAKGLGMLAADLKAELRLRLPTNTY